MWFHIFQEEAIVQKRLKTPVLTGSLAVEITCILAIIDKAKFLLNVKQFKMLILNYFRDRPNLTSSIARNNQPGCNQKFCSRM